MFAVLFLSCEILLKWFGYLSRVFLFSTLERIPIKQTGHHIFIYYTCMHTCIRSIYLFPMLLILGRTISIKNALCSLETDFYCYDISPWSVIYLKGVFTPQNHIVDKGRKMTTLWNFFLASSEKKLCFFLSGFCTFKKKLTPVTHQSICWQNLLWCINATQLNHMWVLKFSKCYHALNRISCTLVSPLKMLS